MSKIVICSLGNDPYDHKERVSHEIISQESWGETGGEGLRQYNEHYQARIKKGVVAWVTINEVDTETCHVKCWLRLKNPEKKRIEINLPAKELKANKVVKKRTIDDILMAQYVTTASNAAGVTSTASSGIPGSWSYVEASMPEPEQEF